MSILINANTKVVTQGITGKTGAFHTRLCREYANGRACFAAGVNPNKAGEDFEGIPIFGSVKEAKERTGATVSVIYVPPPFAASAIDEAVGQLMELGLGQSTCVGIGGDPVNGLKHIDVMKLFNSDPDTDAVIMVGEIGGDDEETCARWIKENMKKPVVGFIAGVTAPPV